MDAQALYRNGTLGGSSSGPDSIGRILAGMSILSLFIIILAALKGVVLPGAAIPRA